MKPIFLILTFFWDPIGAIAGDELRVLTGNLPNGIAPERMVETWMRQRVSASYQQWQRNFLRLQREGGWVEHHRELRETILNCMGGLPERTPLNAKVTGTIERPDFRVEKVLFESQPGFHVTANLYLPSTDRFRPHYPGVLVPCGHAVEAKAHHEYQAMGALLALNGAVGLVFDPIDQSERMQYRTEDGTTPYYGTHMHMQEGVIAILLGEGLIRTFIWDGMRAIDYLEGRPEVDPQRLAVTGNSGGGTQSSYLFALDERLRVAAPSCYVHLLSRQIWDSLGDAEQMVYGQMAIGLEHPTFYLMRAPAPVKILAATHDFFPIDAVWEGFRFIKRRYTDLGFSERADILENNEGHNYDRTQREAAIRWINQWSRGVVSEIDEPDLDLFSEEQLWATPTGQVLDLPGTRSIFDLFRIKLNARRAGRDAAWAEMSASQKREAVRACVGVRSASDIPVPTVHDLGRLSYGAYTVTKRLLETEEGLYLPVLDLSPAQASGRPPLVYLGSESAFQAVEPGGPLEELMREGRHIYAVDIRGMGETRPNNQISQGEFFGTDQADFFAAYVLGECYLGMRVEDILRIVRYAAESAGGTNREVEITADGQAGVAALHAAFLEPEWIKQSVVRNSLKSWESILTRERSYHQLANAVHGGLLVYDLPFLERELGDRLTIERPVDSLGFFQRAEGEPLPDGYEEPDRPGLVGVFFGSSRFLNPQGEYPLDRLALQYDNAVQKRGNDWGGIWHGFLVGPTSGPVVVKAVTDQAVALVVDGKPVFGLDEDPDLRTVSISMQEGMLYPIEVRFQLPSGGKGMFEIRWSWEGGPPTIVDPAFLRHSQAQENDIRRTWR